MQHRILRPGPAQTTVKTAIKVQFSNLSAFNEPAEIP